MAQNPRHVRIKHCNHPLVHLKVTDLFGFLFNFQAQQTHFSKLKEASTGSFGISIYKLPRVTKRKGSRQPVSALLHSSLSLLSGQSQIPSRSSLETQRKNINFFFFFKC